MQKKTVLKTIGAAAAAGALITVALVPKQAPAKEPGSFQRPLTFEPNLGQTDASVSFLARGSHSLWIAGDSATLGLPGQKGAIRMKWLRGNTNAQAKGLDPVASKGNYFIGKDQSKWRTGVPNYARVRLEEIYPGIGLVFHPSQDRNLEYDLEVAPGADPSRIALAFEGGTKLAVEPNGDLRIDTVAGAVVQRKPVAFQSAGAGRREIPVAYEVRKGEVGFHLGEYDSSLPLTIDPVVEVSRFYGGTHADLVQDLAVDGSGNTYIVGASASPDLPMAAGTYQMTHAGGYDAFVAKFTLNGAHLYTTYLGSPGFAPDDATNVAVDSAGSVYLRVWGYNSDFPVVGCGSSSGTSGSLRVKFTNEATVLAYSCRAPITDVAVTSGGTAYWIETVGSQSCLTSGGPAVTTVYCFDASLQAVALNPTGGTWVAGHKMVGTNQQVYVAKIGWKLLGYYILYSNTWGGSGIEEVNDIAVDSEGTAAVTGQTTSSTLPNASGALSGPSDAFLARFSPSGVSAQYIGGSGGDEGTRVALRRIFHPVPATLAYVAGKTSSTDFPANLGFGPACTAGGENAFVWRSSVTLNPGWSGCLGGKDTIGRPTSLALSNAGATRVHVASHTLATTLNPAPTTGQFTNAGSDDAWLVIFRD